MSEETIGRSVVSPKATAQGVPAPFMPIASSSWSDTYFPWKAFNRTTGGSANGWETASGLWRNSWLGISLPEPRTVGSYRMWNRFDYGSSPEFPSQWQLQGTNDADVNTGTWTTLDTRSDAVWGKAAGSSIEFEVEASKRAPYRHYRIFASDRVGTGAWMHISLLHLFNESSDFANLKVANPVDGLNQFVKISGSCPEGPVTVQGGASAGQLLIWDGAQTSWSDPAALRFDATTGLFAQYLTISRGLTFADGATVTDSAGSTGLPGQVLGRDGSGALRWVTP